MTGFWNQPLSQCSCIIPTVPKRDSPLNCLVFNLSALNRFVVARQFKMVMVSQVHLHQRKGAWLVTCSHSFQVPMFPSSTGRITDASGHGHAFQFFIHSEGLCLPAFSSWRRSLSLSRLLVGVGFFQRGRDRAVFEMITMA